MNRLKFSTNWNNKLDCKVFTTIRLFNDKYLQGSEHEILLKNKEGKVEINGTRYQLKGRAIVRLSYKIPVGKLSQGVCLIDTGYSFVQVRKMLSTMYKNRVENFNDDTMMSLVFLEYLRD